MIVNLFEVFVIIGNIDVDKVALNNPNIKKTWVSETPTSYDDVEATHIKDRLDDFSRMYLLKVLCGLLEEKIQYPFEIELIQIWENHYIDNDYQEPHIHVESDFSFVIYKDVKESKTVFINPNKNLISTFGNIRQMFAPNFIPQCRTGQIILFPSFLEHMVLRASNQKTISGNIKFKRR